MYSHTIGVRKLSKFRQAHAESKNLDDIKIAIRYLRELSKREPTDADEEKREKTIKKAIDALYY